MHEPPKILVVDDDVNTVMFIKRILQMVGGYQTCAAYDGEEALSIVKEVQPDLITLGVVMPRLDGYEVCRQLKNNIETRKIPIIMLTGTSKTPNIVNGYESGADHYLIKPFNPQILMAIIKMELTKRSESQFTTSTTTEMPPKVFISYKWESESHNNWVMNLALDLRKAGIEAMLDLWEVRLGDSFTDYMTSKIDAANVFLFIMTTESVSAVEASKGNGGAVKFEMQLAASRRTAGDGLRIIPIYKEGSKTAAHIRDRRYADFRDDSKYETNLQVLINDILGQGQTAPPVLAK